MKKNVMTCKTMTQSLLSAFCMAVAPGVAADLGANGAVSASPSPMIQARSAAREGTVAITRSFSAADAGVSYQDVAAWITAHSPEHAPLLSAGAMTITITRRMQHDEERMSTRSEGPPMALPGSGNSGENITLTQTHPDGSFETWSYTWEESGGGGGWVLMEYHFRKNNDPVNVQ